MTIGTGKTVYEQILSLDVDNNPVTGATFDSVMFKDGIEDTGTTVSVSLNDISRGLFLAEWSASTVGTYQFYTKNNSTSVIFVSDPVSVLSDEEINPNIYIGL
jgi:hypothetical protein